MKKPVFCGLIPIISASETQVAEYHFTFDDLIEAMSRSLHVAASQSSIPSADDYAEAELHIPQRVQNDSFPEEIKSLQTGKAVPSNIRLLTLAPEYDVSKYLIRVGGWVTKIIRSADGKVQTAEVQVDKRSYTRLVAKLIELPAIPEDAPRTAPVIV
eukprot:superscaffoldBa00000434_g4691